MKSVLMFVLVVLVVVFIVYQYDPSFFGLMHLISEGFADAKASASAPSGDPPAPPAPSGTPPAVPGAAPAGHTAMPDPSGALAKKQGFKNKNEGFADLNSYEGPAQFGAAEAPAGCYPRDQLTPSELLPKDMNSIWAEQNPMGPGSLKGKNFLSAGALIGVNTVGQSMRNANLQVRSEPPNPQVAVSIFNQSTISPDISHRPLEIGA